MKAKFLALAALVLGLASCQTEPEGINVDANGEAAVTISVGIPDTETRAGGDDSAVGAFGNVDFAQYDVRYILEVYNLEGQLKGELAKERFVNIEKDGGKSTSFNLRLIPGRDYRFVVWADIVKEGTKTDLHYNTANLKNVQLATEAWELTDETRDAYTNICDVTDFKSSSSVVITLKRPLGKLRVVTTDIKDMFNVLPQDITVAYTSDIYTSFNAFESDVNESGKINDSKTIKISENKYANEWNAEGKVKSDLTLFTDYYFAAKQQEPIQFTLDVKDNNGMAIPQVVFNTAIPIQRNYLTTVKGPILTDANNITVTINDAFENQDNLEDKPYFVEIWDGKTINAPKFDAEKNAYVIEKASELAWVADQVNGVTRAAALNEFKGVKFVIEYDIDLGNEPWTPIGIPGYDNAFNGVIDGQGHKIVNLCVTNVKGAGLIGSSEGATIENLTIEGVELNTNHYAGAFVAWGESGFANITLKNCHVKDAKITITPELVNGKYDNGDKAGAIIGFAYASIIENCSAENVEVTAFRDVAGIAGYASKGRILNCSVKDAVITADQIHEYDGEKDGNAGVIVGRIGEPVTLDGNTDANVVVNRKVNSTTEFAEALKDRRNDDVIYVGEGEVVLPASLAITGNDKLTIEGIDAKAAVQFNSKPGGTDGGLNCYADGTELIFKNIKVVSPNTGSAYTGGFGRAKSVLFDNCYYEGQYRSMSYVKFNKCTIDPKTSYIYTDYSDADFVECTFNCSEGKGIQVYNDGNTTNTTINVTDCTFTAAKQGQTYDKKPVTAIDINSNGEKFTVNIDRTTATGFPKGEYTDETLFNIKGGADYVEVYIDGNKWAKDGNYTDANGNPVVDVENADELAAALENIPADGGATINVPEGEYTFPATKLHEGIILNCAEGTVFKGSSNLNIGGATIVGADFVNENGSIHGSTINGNFKDCTFEGNKVFYYCYAGNGTQSVFEDCYFKENGGEWLFHFDGGNGELICRRCTFDGERVAVGSAVSNLVMEDCTFVNGLYFNTYCKTTITGTSFETSIRPLGNHVTLNNCTYYGEALKFEDLKLYSGYDCKVTVDDKDYAVVSVANNFTKYIEEAERDINVYMIGHIFDKVTILQKADVDVFIAGNGNTLRSVYIHGNARHNGAETLTFDNVHFSAFDSRDLISADSTGSVERYAHNVTIQNCSFEGDDGVDVVGLRLRQAYNVTIKDCTTKKLHSLGQITSVNGLTIEGVTFNGNSGLNLLTSCQNVNIKNTTINATEEDGYGIRMDAGNDNTVNVENSAITAYEPIVFRSASTAFKFNLVGTNNTITKKGDYHIVVKSGVCPTLTGADYLDIKLP